MSIGLKVLQVLLAFHTLMGAVWKFSKTAEESMPTLKAIPTGVWIGMGILEILCAVALVVPLFHKSLNHLTIVAALLIAVEMLIFSFIHVSSGDKNFGPILYWIIVASLCTLVAYGSFILNESKN